MKHSDKLSGMNRSITRRDVLFGVASLSLSPLLVPSAKASEPHNFKGSSSKPQLINQPLISTRGANQTA